MRPMGDRLLVTRVKADSVSKGGIYIPPTAQEKTSEGTVVVVGNGSMLADGRVRPLDVLVGEKILFDKYSGTEVKIDDQEYTVLREQNVCCVLES